MHILLVEDEVRLAENVAAALRETPGYAVDCASDGQIGASLASNRCYDLIILDLILPLLDGQGVLRKLRANIYGILFPRIHTRCRFADVSIFC
jgi:DNA-binding response OmpR family regulator